MAKALADETTLAQFAEDYDSQDIGLLDVWETLIATGRRLGEVTNLRLNCTDVAELLLLLYALRPAAISQLTLDDINTSDNMVTLRLRSICSMPSRRTGRSVPVRPYAQPTPPGTASHPQYFRR